MSEYDEIERIKNEINNNKLLSEFVKIHLIQFANELQDYVTGKSVKNN